MGGKVPSLGVVALSRVIYRAVIGREADLTTAAIVYRYTISRGQTFAERVAGTARESVDAAAYDLDVRTPTAPAC